MVNLLHVKKSLRLRKDTLHDIATKQLKINFQWLPVASLVIYVSTPSSAVHFQSAGETALPNWMAWCLLHKNAWINQAFGVLFYHAHKSRLVLAHITTSWALDSWRTLVDDGFVRRHRGWSTRFILVLGRSVPGAIMKENVCLANGPSLLLCNYQGESFQDLGNLTNTFSFPWTAETHTGTLAPLRLTSQSE